MRATGTGTLGAALLAVAVLGGARRDARAGDALAPADVSFFHDPLAAHGEWSRLEPYGWAWSPSGGDAAWRPYRDGRWAWTAEAGWTWVSDEPFGWAVFHYGRWLHLEDRGWVWLPGIVWAPAWVEWRVSDAWTGWAPLPPAAGWRPDAGPVDVAVAIPPFAWVFVPTRDVADADLSTRVARVVHAPALLRATPQTRTLVVADGRVTDPGVERERVEALRGAPVARLRLRGVDRPDGASPVRLEADALVVPQPALAVRDATAAPPARPPLPADEARRRLERRAESVRRHLERERRAVDEEPDPAPEGAEAGGVAHSRREEALEAYEQERRRLERRLESERRRLEDLVTPGGPGPGTTDASIAGPSGA